MRVGIPRPVVHIRSPPGDFDALFEWFERVSYALVLLEEFSLSDIRDSVAVVRRGLTAHIESPWPFSLASRTDLERVVAADHAWFRISLDQLDWFLRIVEKEDHGGHRQALGQYGRLLSESVGRHRRDERAVLRIAPPLAGQP